MSTREKASTLKGALSDYADPELVQNEKEAWADAAAEKHAFPKFPEVEPDEIDLKMIAEAEADDSEPMPIEDFAKELGIDYESL